jgi:putative two-component system response regulator
MLLGELLKREFEVFVAEDGTKAVESAKRIGPDLILLDVMMPGLDGYSACRMLKADPELADVPVIFITAKSDSDDVVLALRSAGRIISPSRSILRSCTRASGRTSTCGPPRRGCARTPCGLKT